MSSLEINNPEVALQIASFIRETDMRMRLMQMPCSAPFDFHFGGNTLKDFEQEVLIGLRTLNRVLILPGMPKIYYEDCLVLGVNPSQHPETFLDIVTPTIRPDILAVINYDPSTSFSLLLPNGNEPQFQPLV